MIPVTILIPNFRAGEAIQLCLESLFKRTDYALVKITVLDSSGKDSEDRKYLESLAHQKRIKLLTSDRQLLHGHAIWKLLESCQTELACIMDSDIMVIRSDWLRYLISHIQDDKTLGVGYYKCENGIPKMYWRTPRYVPFVLLMNMPLYREIADDQDWDEDYSIPWDQCRDEYKKLFRRAVGRHPYLKSVPNEVFGDCGWRFCEKVFYGGYDYKMINIPWTPFFTTYVKHWGAMSIYHDNPEHQKVKDKLPEIQGELRKLRNNA